MNKNNIIEWIDNPATIDEDATRALRDIVQEFPASPILHWLYLKGLQNQKSYLFNSALSRAAIGSPNRSQLLKWVGLEQSENEDSKKQRFEFVIPEIKKEPEVKVEEEVKVPPVKVEEKKPEPKRELPKPPPPRVKKKTPADLPDDIKALLEKSKRIRTGYISGHAPETEKAEPTQTEPVLEETPVASKIEVPSIEPIETVQVKEEKVEIPKIEEKATEVEADSAEIPQTKIEDLAFSMDEPKEEETFFSIDLDVGVEEVDVEVDEAVGAIEAENSFAIELEDYSTEPEVEPVEEKIREDIPETEDADFTAWLKTLNSAEANRVAEKEPKQEFQKDEISFELVTDVVPIEPVKIDPVKEKKMELIDKFLEEKPKITPRKEDFSSLNIAEPAESADNQFVTETLAKVYVAQGHFGKAIEAYEILGLKYPEKNSFFADRIREIKRRK